MVIVPKVKIVLCVLTLGLVHSLAGAQGTFIERSNVTGFEQFAWFRTPSILAYVQTYSFDKKVVPSGDFGSVYAEIDTPGFHTIYVGAAWQPDVTVVPSDPTLKTPSLTTATIPGYKIDYAVDANGNRTYLGLTLGVIEVEMAIKDPQEITPVHDAFRSRETHPGSGLVFMFATTYTERQGSILAGGGEMRFVDGAFSYVIVPAGTPVQPDSTMGYFHSKTLSVSR